MKPAMRTAMRWLGYLRNPWGTSSGPEARTVGETRFVVLDTETTGLDAYRDRILSIGLVPIQNGRIRIRDTREWFLRQDVFREQSVPIHGIMKEGPNTRLPEREVLLMLSDYLKDSVVVGHHIAFDRSILQYAYRRQELPMPEPVFLDTEHLYRHTRIKSPLLRKKERYPLDDLAAQYDISCKDRHTALGDAHITALAFMHMLQDLRMEGTSALSSLFKKGRIA